MMSEVSYGFTMTTFTLDSVPALVTDYFLECISLLNTLVLYRIHEKYEIRSHPLRNFKIIKKIKLLNNREQSDFIGSWS